MRNRVFGDQPIPPTRKLCRGIALTRSGRQAGAQPQVRLLPKLGRVPQHHLRPPPVLADGPVTQTRWPASDSGAPNFERSSPQMTAVKTSSG